MERWPEPVAAVTCEDLDWEHEKAPHHCALRVFERVLTGLVQDDAEKAAEWQLPVGEARPEWVPTGMPQTVRQRAAEDLVSASQLCSHKDRTVSKGADAATRALLAHHLSVSEATHERVLEAEASRQYEWTDSSRLQESCDAAHLRPSTCVALCLRAVV